MAGSSKLRKYRADHEDLNTNSRSAIIEAGRTLFLRQGIASTTMGAISEHAGVSRVTVYRHFPECGAIAFEVYAQMLERIVDAIQTDTSSQANALDSAREVLQSLFAAYSAHEPAFRFCAAYRSFYAIEARSDELVDWYRAREFKELGEACFSLIGSRLQADTANQVRALTDVAANGLCSLALREAVSGADSDSQLRNLEALVLGHFDTAITPNA